MKKRLFFLLSLVFSLNACTSKSDSILGDWIVDKVKVQFDESRNTPELVKQIGEMERQNRISISSDSILIFNTLDNETKGRLKLSAEGTMFCDDAVFGQWKNGEIVTKTDSPLGEIVVSYRKK